MTIWPFVFAIVIVAILASIATRISANVYHYAEKNNTGGAFAWSVLGLIVSTIGLLFAVCSIFLAMAYGLGLSLALSGALTILSLVAGFSISRIIANIREKKRKGV